ncbi:MAG: cyclic nucleotide-binding domain-containing protein [Anaerolineales bacterium]|jgi:uncharacterized protein
MKTPDYDSARKFALKLLEDRLPSRLTYHSLSHTRDHVVPAVERLAKLEGIQGEDLLLLKTAAYYHDVGHIQGRQNHEEEGVRVVEANLPGFNYSPEQIQVIRELIMATKMPQSPTSSLGEILADADLDVLGRADYFKRNLDLRHEWATGGEVFTDLEWYSSQLNLLITHDYFTESARMLRDKGKQRNREAVAKLIEHLKGDAHVDLDKLVILKSVNIFSAIPEPALIKAVDLLKEVNVKNSHTFIHKGDQGSSMFILAEGKMLVHDGDLHLNELHPYDIFGEMAALDPEVRSASITAVEDTLLYELDQEDLLYLVETQSAVTRGIFHILCERMRNLMEDRADDFEYIQQFERVIAAAVAVEEGKYQPEMIEGVTKRRDELGQLARVFQRMLRLVEARENQLKREVKDLKIEIDKVKQARQVAEITETEYFQELRSKISELRASQGSEDQV